MTKYELTKVKELDEAISQLNEKFEQLNLNMKIAFLLLNNLKNVEYEICENDNIERIIIKSIITSILMKDKQAREKLILSIISIDSTFLKHQELNPFIGAEIILKEFWTDDTIIGRINFDFKHKCECKIDLTIFFNDEETKAILKATKDIVINSLNNIIEDLKEIVKKQNEELENVKKENKDLHEKLKDLISENLKLRNEIEKLEQENKTMREKLENVKYVLDDNLE